ncbi:hypothetical protein BC102111_01777 [Brevibacterium casei CIP 102111]|uniref:Uncharacterized protein n=2 Tax=Brevibacterium casei TaxID=33889 RepID=A0A2H1IZW0_9MICO|nr:hypothetical protein BC102111_01777 [Brevibacterium casei CIP 102111]VEW15253.1 Uncharacterised protein [Brevibacterium casei]
MSFRTSNLKPSVTTAPVQRWALIAGWGSLLLPLPSVLWRLLMLAGVDVGFGLSGEVRESAAGIGYVLGLEVLTVLVAVLGFGLIRRWGEVVPGWVPRLGGRTIPPLVPIIVGGIGSAVLLGLIGSVLAKFVLAWTGTVPGWTPDVGMTAGERAFLLTCYVPFFLWPVAIASALIGYAGRRLGTRPGRTRVRQGRAPIVC